MIKETLMDNRNQLVGIRINKSEMVELKIIAMEQIWYTWQDIEILKGDAKAVLLNASIGWFNLMPSISRYVIYTGR